MAQSIVGAAETSVERDVRAHPAQPRRRAPRQSRGTRPTLAPRARPRHSESDTGRITDRFTHASRDMAFHSVVRRGPKLVPARPYRVPPIKPAIFSKSYVTFCDVFRVVVK